MCCIRNGGKKPKDTSALSPRRHSMAPATLVSPRLRAYNSTPIATASTSASTMTTTSTIDSGSRKDLLPFFVGAESGCGPPAGGGPCGGPGGGGAAEYPGGGPCGGPCGYCGWPCGYCGCPPCGYCGCPPCGYCGCPPCGYCGCCGGLRRSHGSVTPAILPYRQGRSVRLLITAMVSRTFWALSRSMSVTSNWGSAPADVTTSPTGDATTLPPTPVGPSAAISLPGCAWPTAATKPVVSMARARANSIHCSSLPAPVPHDAWTVMSCAPRRANSTYSSGKRTS